jgi:hypothetical protein
VAHKGELLSVQRMRGLAVLMLLMVHVEDIAQNCLPGLESTVSMQLA